MLQRMSRHRRCTRSRGLAEDQGPGGEALDQEGTDEQGGAGVAGDAQGSRGIMLAPHVGRLSRRHTFERPFPNCSVFGRLVC